MDETILKLMVRHHSLIEVLFLALSDEIKAKGKNIASMLAEFTWELRKHFFVEESAIFDYLPIRNFGVFETINHLKDEHVIMLQNLRKIEERLPEIDDEDFKNFSEMLVHHRQIEENDLYPKLDKELQDEQKASIISRINQIPFNPKQ